MVLHVHVIVHTGDKSYFEVQYWELLGLNKIVQKSRINIIRDRLYLQLCAQNISPYSPEEISHAINLHIQHAQKRSLTKSLGESNINFRFTFFAIVFI